MLASPRSSLDLRDHFAIHFATALMRRQHSAEYIVARAYDLADAMLAERARRIDAEAADAGAEGPPLSVGDEGRPSYHHSLLDEPPPPEEADSEYEAYLDELGPGDAEIDPRWLDPEMDPSWEVEPRWAIEPAAASAEPFAIAEADADPLEPAARPGLARTQPEEAGEGSAAAPVNRGGEAPASPAGADEVRERSA